MPIKTPAIRYHGAKFRIAPWIISHFPEHRCYTESFGGAAGVLLQKERSYAEVYNDLDGDIVNFFRVIRDPELCNKLIQACTLTPYAREEFEAAKIPSDDPIENALRVAVRATMGFGSAGATRAVTGFRIDTKREYSTPMHLWSRYPENIAAIGERFAGVLIENRPAIEVIKQHDAPDTLHFVDPPYLHETRHMGGNKRCYQFEMSKADHIELAETLKKVQGMVVLCGYPSELYDDLFSDWETFSIRSRISAFRGTKTKEEVIWLNDATSNALKNRQMTLIEV